MSFLQIAAALLVYLASSTPPGNKENVSPRAYQLTARLAVDVLPENLRGFFAEEVPALTRAAVDPSYAQDSNDKSSHEAGRHFIALDAGAGANKSWPARLTVARRFPRDRQTAEKLFRKSGVEDGGSLPWEIDKQFRALTAAFENGDRNAITRTSGALLHYLTDAALPWNTTVQHGDNVGADEQEKEAHRHPTARQLFHLELIDHLHARLSTELRLAPSRYHPTTEPLPVVFTLLVESFQTIEVLNTHQTEVVGIISNTDELDEQERSERYYHLLGERCGHVIEHRLESAALAAANLIGGAWHRADRPALPIAKTGTTDTQGPATRASSEKFVGSRNSSVYHRAGCRHASRIKTGNLVQFDTADQATSQGKRPCRTCKP